MDASEALIELEQAYRDAKRDLMAAHALIHPIERDTAKRKAVRRIEALDLAIEALKRRPGR